MDPSLALSKLFWMLAEPSSALLLAWLAGSVLLWTRWRHWGRGLVTAAALVTFAVAMFPIGPLLLQPIEDRFPPAVTLPPRVDGVIVLGGVVDDYIIGKRGVPKSMTATASPRLDAFLEIMRRYPLARHIFTGGSITLINGRDTEADVVRRIFARIGVDTTRIIFEDRSRNTFENAVFTYELVKPEPDQIWIIITSARHMPRAIGTFRKAGWHNLVAFPVDFATERHEDFQPDFGLGSNLHFVSEALREYIGLLAYHLMDRTDSLFPKPLPAASLTAATPAPG